MAFFIKEMAVQTLSQHKQTGCENQQRRLRFLLELLVVDKINFGEERGERRRDVGKLHERNSIVARLGRIEIIHHLTAIADCFLLYSTSWLSVQTDGYESRTRRVKREEFFSLSFPSSPPRTTTTTTDVKKSF
jgi:hypothetical protein